jgi:glutathione S-transferase
MTIKLYHNGMSTCSQKVRMALAEKQLNFESVILDLQRGDQFSAKYLQVNPGALVPALEDNGQVYIESTLINDYLDDAYADPALAPATAHERYRMRYLIKQIDDVQHPACSVITYAIGLRPIMLQKDPQELQSLIDQVKDPVRRENRRLVLADGVHTPVFRTALLQYLEVLTLADDMLGTSRWLAGSSFSLADCALTPYVLRLAHLGQKGMLDKMLNLSRWYEALQARPSYKTAVTDWLPERAVQMFTAGGMEVQQAVADMV